MCTYATSTLHMRMLVVEAMSMKVHRAAVHGVEQKRRTRYCGMGSCGVISTSGSAIRPLWLASISELRGMAVAASLICAARAPHVNACALTLGGASHAPARRRRCAAAARRGAARAVPDAEAGSTTPGPARVRRGPINPSPKHGGQAGRASASTSTRSRLGCTASTLPTGTPRMRTGVPTVIPHASGNSSTHCRARARVCSGGGGRRRGGSP